MSEIAESTLPTLKSLVADAIDAMKDYIADHPGSNPREFTFEIALEAVPSTTSTLFAMVVADNSLAFLEDADLGETQHPFDALHRAIYTEVERRLLDWLEERGR